MYECDIRRGRAISSDCFIILCVGITDGEEWVW